MGEPNSTVEKRVALITGGAQRIGATIVQALHAAGMHVAIHFRHSEAAAQALHDSLAGQKPGSVSLHQADLNLTQDIQRLVNETLQTHGRLDALINNASAFYPTTLDATSEEQWEDLMGSNLKAPFFLARHAADHLTKSRGCIVNIADIYGLQPLPGHVVYSTAKAGLLMLTRSLAVEMAPSVRVNAVAPGAILWPENDIGEAAKTDLLQRTPLNRRGKPAEIAAAVMFLINNATFTTGATIPVDGGRLSAGH